MIVPIILISIISGIVAGMGMGGGTVLIPLLTFVAGVNQQAAQAINLIAFIPLAIVVLIIYHKKGLLKLKSVWWVIVPGVIVSSFASIFSVKISSSILKVLFGIFLIVSGVLLIISLIIKYQKDKGCDKISN